MVKRSLPRSGAYDLTRLKKIYCVVFVNVMLSFSYLPVYLWKEKMKREKKDAFKEMLKLISKRQNQDQGDGCNFGEVCIFCGFAIYRTYNYCKCRDSKMIHVPTVFFAERSLTASRPSTDTFW